MTKGSSAMSRRSRRRRWWRSLQVNFQDWMKAFIIDDDPCDLERKTAERLYQQLKVANVSVATQPVRRRVSRH